MKTLDHPQHSALRSRMQDVQENMLELFSAAAMDSTMGWENIQIEAPETESDPPALRLVA